ncbi:helix-turn-helix domain-containing protein [Xanthomonas citri pv. citri]|uniref:helix-turn-helix transcriptional regulator n=1 Tax=Xanthomonas citri TaxID=346 RepID=UPI0036DB8274
MAYEPKKFSPAELAELHALPDDSLLTAQEAAAFLRLKYGTLAWYRCQGGGPAFTRVGPKLIRYRMGDLRDYAKASRWAKASGAPRRRCSRPAPPTRRADR